VDWPKIAHVQNIEIRNTRLIFWVGIWRHLIMLQKFFNHRYFNDKLLLLDSLIQLFYTFSCQLTKSWFIIFSFQLCLLEIRIATD
jgi:hypothetical protein